MEEKKKRIVSYLDVKIDEAFRNEVEKQGKQYSLALEEAIELWIKKVEKNNL